MKDRQFPICVHFIVYFAGFDRFHSSVFLGDVRRDYRARQLCVLKQMFVSAIVKYSLSGFINVLAIRLDELDILNWVK